MSNLSASDYRKIMRSMINQQQEGMGGVRRKPGRPRKRPVKRRGNGVIGGKKQVNPWVRFVKQFAKQHNLTYSDALVQAAPYYHGF
jgi:hypothetical protein